MVGRPMKDPNAVTRYSLNREYYLEYERTRRTPEYKEKQRIYQHNYYRKNREKILARQSIIEKEKRARARKEKEAAAAAKKAKQLAKKEPKPKKEKKVKKQEIKFYVPEETPTFKEVPMTFTENDWA